MQENGVNVQLHMLGLSHCVAIHQQHLYPSSSVACTVLPAVAGCEKDVSALCFTLEVSSDVAVAYRGQSVYPRPPADGSGGCCVMVMEAAEVSFLTH